MSRTEQGRSAEALAEKYLRSQGLVILARNVRYRRGEIDIIAQEGEEIVFVEVRCRRRGSRCGPVASVGPAKQERLLRAAQRWLGEQGLGVSRCRFDIVGVTAAGDGFRIRHHRAAFLEKL